MVRGADPRTEGGSPPFRAGAGVRSASTGRAATGLRWPTRARSTTPQGADPMPEFPAMAHVAVTVTDLERSKESYGR